MLYKANSNIYFECCDSQLKQFKIATNMFDQFYKCWSIFDTNKYYIFCMQYILLNIS